MIGNQRANDGYKQQDTLFKRQVTKKKGWTDQETVSNKKKPKDQLKTNNYQRQYEPVNENNRYQNAKTKKNKHHTKHQKMRTPVGIRKQRH